MRNSLFAGVVVLAALSVAALGQQFVVPVERFPLTKAANNIDGWFEVLADSRITPALKQKMWGKGDWETALDEKDPLRASFTKDAPDDVLFRIMMKNGYVAKTEPLDRPICMIKPEQWPGGKVIYFVTVDYSSDPEEGPTLSTRLMQIYGAHFEWLEAKEPRERSTEPEDQEPTPTDKKSRRAKEKEEESRRDHDPTKPIRLSRSQNADWKIADAASSRDILQVFTRASSLDKSTIIYVRFHFDGKNWMRTEKEEPGDWDSKQAFPPVVKFP
jgi:hypothetical protein